MEREAIIRPLAEQLRLSHAIIDDAAKQLHLSRVALYRLLRRYRERPQTSSLLPWTRGRHCNSRFLSKDREALIATCIRGFYLVQERPSLAALFQEVRRCFAEHQLATPNYRTVVKRVAAIDPHLAMTKREGAKAARDKFGPVGVSRLRPERLMEVLQIDHTPVDVIVVDQEQRRPIGRPWLTLAIDVTSRSIAGFSVSLENPSALSVSLVLSHAVLPKETWLADRELHTLDWPMGGLPTSIHVDNAKEFHSEALTRGCQEYGIAIDYREPGLPHFGGHVERMIGTMMGAVHLLPGTTFSNVAKKGTYDSEGRAVLTLPELERWLALQIAGVYHLTVHSALGKTPFAAWQEGLEERKQSLRHPTDADEFFLDFLPAVPRIIQRDGIHFHNLCYWSSVLSPWAGRLKQPLLVKYDPRNLACVYVRDPSGKHWPIPYADLRLPPIALWELEAARRLLQKDGTSGRRQDAVFAAVLQQRRLVNEATKHSQQRRRQERTPLQPKTSPAIPVPTKIAAQDELKPFPVEIWPPQ